MLFTRETHEEAEHSRRSHAITNRDKTRLHHRSSLAQHPTTHIPEQSRMRSGDKNTLLLSINQELFTQTVTHYSSILNYNEYYTHL